VFTTGFTNLYSRDVEASLAFYRDLLGLGETFRTPTEGTPDHVELSLGEFRVGVSSVEAARRVHGVEATPGHPVMSLVIWCDDVDREFARLRAARVPVDKEPHDSGNNNRTARVRDPDGTLVEIVSKVTPA
jgi:catechol 2,3-dioxygenase-like lactoylglutathione lyase family enzyme